MVIQDNELEYAHLIRLRDLYEERRFENLKALLEKFVPEPQIVAYFFEDDRLKRKADECFQNASKIRQL